MITASIDMRIKNGYMIISLCYVPNCTVSLMKMIPAVIVSTNSFQLAPHYVDRIEVRIIKMEDRAPVRQLVGSLLLYPRSCGNAGYTL